MNSSERKNEILCIIPARGGSKGIIGKNLKFLCGQPLIQWTIQAALQSKYINRLIVSTDCFQIAQSSRIFGAEVISRPAQISGDDASSEIALLHVLDHLIVKENYKPDIIVFLQCTSPLTSTEDIDGTINCLIHENADSALSVCTFHYFIWKNENNSAVGINHNKGGRLLRQQREPEYIETGSVYVMRTNGFLQAKHRFFGKTALYEIPAEHHCEIDEPADLIVAEAKLRIKLEKSREDLLPKKISALILDFDGVFTDNTVLVDQNGKESVICHRGDGWGLTKLKETGILIVVISTEINSVVAARCKKLDIMYYHNVTNKKLKMQQILTEYNIESANVIYVGNDINDCDCMCNVGCPVAVADAHPNLLPFAKLILEKRGGHGALRELCDLLEKHINYHAQGFEKS